MQPIRTAILGFAHGHVDTYASRWKEQPQLGVQVVAGWDHDAGRAETACRKHALEKVDLLADLLRRSDVEAVVIGSETSMHAELVEQAARAGKKIVLQKPLCLTLDEADRIVQAVGQARVPFTLAWQMRVDPHNLKMKELLASGRFGRLYMVRRRHCLPTQNWKDFEKSWHVQPRFNRDIFADDASHPIDFIHWLLGAPRSVVAEMGTLRSPAVVNDNAIAVYRYADGAFAEVSCTFAAAAGENTTEIVCEHGVIVGNYGDLVSSLIPRPPGGIQLKWFHKDDGAWTVSEVPDVPNHALRIQGLAAPLAEFLQGRRPPIATAEEGRMVLKMTLACYESAEQGKRIELA